MKYIDELPIVKKKVLIRVDFNVSLNEKHHIINDERIRQILPTLEHLLERDNILILLSHLGKPKGFDPTLSLHSVAKRLQQFLPDKKVMLVPDLESLLREKTRMDDPNLIYLLENIRFNKGEEENNLIFAKYLASCADIFVNDAFSVSHRKAASIVTLPSLLPSFGGLLMKKEVENISPLLTHPKHPFITLLGGAKISTKIKLLKKLLTLSDEVLLGGGLANTFLKSLGKEIGNSLYESTEVKTAKELLQFAKSKNTSLLLPVDAIIGAKNGIHTQEKSIHDISPHDTILDIGPQTQAIYGSAIATAKTILWNGPFGYIENEMYKRGTDFIYYAIAENEHAISIVGGGETLAALTKKEHLDKITHISTGGGAMLSFIENGSLPGIDALTSPVRK